MSKVCIDGVGDNYLITTKTVSEFILKQRRVPPITERNAWMIAAQILAKAVLLVRRGLFSVLSRPGVFSAFSRPE